MIRPEPCHRPGLCVALCLVALGAGGCASVQPATFPAVGPTPVWPPPPDAPRIRYIGELTGEASIGRRITAGEAWRSALAGPRETMRFATPMAVTVEGSRVFVADPSHGTGPLIHVLDLQSQRYEPIREVGGAALRWPIDVDAAGGKLAIADAQRAAVLVLDWQTRSSQSIGQGILARPASVAWDRGVDGLWVVDAAAHAVLRFDAAGALRSTRGGRGVGVEQFNFPAGLACFGAARAAAPPSYRVAVADSMNFRVQLLADAAAAARAFGRKGDAAGDFSLPRDVAIDSDGHIYVLDNQFENVQVFDGEGRLLLAFGEEGRGPGMFNLPSGISIDEHDRIWIADTYNRRVQVFQYIAEGRP